MLVAGDYSDALRAIGRFFEEIKAAEIRIADQGKTLLISWRDQAALSGCRSSGDAGRCNARSASAKLGKALRASQSPSCHSAIAGNRFKA